MARQALLPGYGFVNESGTRQALVPGGYLNETIAGTQALTITPSGGAVGGGTGTLVRGGIAAISGGAVAGGAATVSSSVATQSVSWAAGGGGLGGGSCVIIRGVAVAPSGGAVSGGAANVVNSDCQTIVFSPAGGAIGGGRAHARSGYTPVLVWINGAWTMEIMERLIKGV